MVPCMCGSAIFVIVVSILCIKVAAMIETVIAVRLIGAAGTSPSDPELRW